MPNISLLLITKNESVNLDKWKTWLTSLKPINELVVIDSQSTDDTVKKIKGLTSPKLKVKIFEAENPSDFSSLRSQALSHCTNNWILWLDADESPSNKLIQFINNFDFSNYNYTFLRQDLFIGQILKHGETANQHFLRLFDKRHGKFIGQVHEVWQSSKEMTQTNYVINHHSHPSLYTFFQKLNLYSTLRANELRQQGIRTNIFLIVFYPIAKFFQNYFIFQGFLDGTAGIIFALGMSFHSFLVRAKLWHSSQPSSH
ncbi:glycosyltransferase family 2 protein [Candidatus Shapirobacteria bacterium]|nr:glycosyltransferase family 2 protein [Candidatus Shapirobacteria bacterium]